MKSFKVGLLPFYLQLYDDTCSYMRPRIEKFYDEVSQLLSKKGLEVLKSDLCRNHHEFCSAIQYYENEKVSAIITIHLSYSPSLESIEALAATKIPLIILNTTETYSFNMNTDPEEIMYNHGIHGVQDLCNLLIRHNKYFLIHSGHYLDGALMDDIYSSVQAATIAQNLSQARVGLVGEPFKGMGDFLVPFHELKEKIGITAVQYDMSQGEIHMNDVSDTEINVEFILDSHAMRVDHLLKRDVYNRSAKTALGLRRWVTKERLTAFSINFLATENSPAGLPVMPFTECSKSMANGIGYAGEGDVLTAALVGAILQIYPDASFSEMFCPDWEGNSVFLSHMGEINLLACKDKPFLTEKDFPFANSENPTVLIGTFKSGQACFVNIAPAGNGTYKMILSKGEMMDVPSQNSLAKSINGWFKPKTTLSDFFSKYSQAGGTHHGVIVYTDETDILQRFAQFKSFDVVTI